MFTLYFVAFWCFCLSFEFHFLIHLAPLMHHLLPLLISSFLSLIPLDSFVYSWQKGGEYTGEYTRLFRHFFLTYVHILRERNSTSCTFIGGESHKGDAYTKGEKTYFFEKTLLCFVLLYAYFLIVLWCFELCLVSMLCCSHRIILKCWTCIHPYAIVLYWLHVRMIIYFALWLLWSFPYDYFVFNQVAHMFYNMFTWSQFTCYIILILLLLALPWRSNVFCASVSGYRYICSKCITTSRIRCEWVFPLFPNSRLSLDSILGCFVTE